MKINEGLSVLFFLYKAKKTKDGTAPLYVRITVNGDRANFSSGKKVHPDDWDEKNGRVKSPVRTIKPLTAISEIPN